MNVKAIGLLSGGLDSALAVKLVQNQGISVEAVNFVSPFCLCKKGGCGAVEAAKSLGVPLKMISVGDEYLRMVRAPRFGYGKNMNPCIDCRIFMLTKAKEYAEKTSASFIFTGEVVGQRPMSQHVRTLGLIEEEAGLKGKIVRPLSAKLLPITEAERKGLLKREAFLGIAGRSRKNQFKLADELNVTAYSCPSGGCLLTDREFACRLRDLFLHKEKVSVRDVQLLKVGRHFRSGKNKIVVGRNEVENKLLVRMKTKSDFFFEAQDCGSPVTLLQGPKTEAAVRKTAGLTAYYCDRKDGVVPVRFGRKEFDRIMEITRPSDKDVQRLRLAQ